MIYKPIINKRPSNKPIVNELPSDIIIANIPIINNCKVNILHPFVNKFNNYKNINILKLNNTIVTPLTITKTPICKKSLMVSNAIINNKKTLIKTSVFRSILMLTIASNIFISANCSENNQHNNIYNINNPEYYCQDKLNNTDIQDINLQRLKDNCYEKSNISIKIQPPNNIKKPIIDVGNNMLDPNNTLSIDNILKKLWVFYNILTTPQDGSKAKVISITDSVMQKSIDDINNEHNKLLTKRNNFKRQKIEENNKREEAIHVIKKKTNNDIKKLCLQKFIQIETNKFANNTKYIYELKEQHEIINNKRAIIDTYCKIQSILSDGTSIDIKINNSFDKDLSNSLDVFYKKVSENINSFYDTCLIGHIVTNETIQDKLNLINNKIIELKNNPNNSSNILKIINKKVSELENSSNIKNITNDLKKLISTINKLTDNIKLKNIKSNLLNINKKIYKLISNVELHNIRNNLNIKEQLPVNEKLVMPTTNNILSWCSENYEDWEEALSYYEEAIVNAFKYKANKGTLKQEEFNNTFKLLNKVAVINLKIENYYRTAKLLCNLSHLKQPCPIRIKVV